MVLNGAMKLEVSSEHEELALIPVDGFDTDYEQDTNAVFIFGDEDDLDDEDDFEDEEEYEDEDDDYEDDEEDDDDYDEDEDDWDNDYE